MDKDFLYRLEDTLLQVRNKLINNENLRTLIYYDSSELSEDVDIPAPELIKDNIICRPFIETDNDEFANRKIFISITAPATSFIADNAVDHAIKVSVMVDKTMWTYVDKNDKLRIRIYGICQEIINTLDGSKFQPAGTLDFAQMIDAGLNKTINGKGLIFGINDGVGE